MIPAGRIPLSAADRRRRASRALWVCIVLLCASPASAEKADREKPIHLEADRVTVDDAKQLAVFEGNVVLTQGTMVIRGSRMEVRQDNEGFKSGITWGDLAYFRQKRDGADDFIEGWAARIEYDGRADKVQMFDRASLKRGQDEVKGNYISYDSKTEFFQVIGGKNGAAGESGGRVRAVLQPKSKDKPEAQPPVPLKPAGALTPPPGDAGRIRK